MSLILVIYLVFALSFTTHMAGNDTCNGLHINVIDSASRGFVTSEDIVIELGPMCENIRNIKHDSINTYAIEQQIMSKDNIEKANCMILNDGSVRLDVTPLIPLARVFEHNGENYYINRAGKHMKATTRYRMDVPVILGNFKGNQSPTRAFAVLDYLAKNKEIDEYISAIEIAANGDIILVPNIRGHVINLGDSTDLKNKFDRLKVFYRKVMPAKGWEYYDTLSVKWRGQIVAKRRYKKIESPQILVEEHSDLDDISTMLTTTTSNNQN